MSEGFALCQAYLAGDGLALDALADWLEEAGDPRAGRVRLILALQAVDVDRKHPKVYDCYGVRPHIDHDNRTPMRVPSSCRGRNGVGVLLACHFLRAVCLKRTEPTNLWGPADWFVAARELAACRLVKVPWLHEVSYRHSYCTEPLSSYTKADLAAKSFWGHAGKLNKAGIGDGIYVNLAGGLRSYLANAVWRGGWWVNWNTMLNLYDAWVTLRESAPFVPNNLPTLGTIERKA